MGRLLQAHGLFIQQRSADKWKTISSKVKQNLVEEGNRIIYTREKFWPTKRSKLLQNLLRIYNSMLIKGVTLKFSFSDYYFLFCYSPLLHTLLAISNKFQEISYSTSIWSFTVWLTLGLGTKKSYNEKKLRFLNKSLKFCCLLLFLVFVLYSLWFPVT